MKFTAEEVEKAADGLADQDRDISKRVEMLNELARRLRAEEEERKRDVAKEPRPGDMLILNPTNRKVFIGDSAPMFDEFAWATMCQMNPNATLIPRREVEG